MFLTEDIKKDEKIKGLEECLKNNESGDTLLSIVYWLFIEL